MLFFAHVSSKGGDFCVSAKAGLGIGGIQYHARGRKNPPTSLYSQSFLFFGSIREETFLFCSFFRALAGHLRA